MNSDRLKRAMRAAFGSAVGTVRGNGKGLVLGRGRTARAECRDALQIERKLTRQRGGNQPQKVLSLRSRSSWSAYLWIRRALVGHPLNVNETRV
jgi:hypothetical protein